jgi:hypothetical protein
MKDEERPSTTATLLLEVAEWLDLADEAFDVLRRQQGKESPLRGAGRVLVQDDVRALARWFAQVPETDRSAWRFVEAWPSGGDDGDRFAVGG